MPGSSSPCRPGRLSARAGTAPAGAPGEGPGSRCAAAGSVVMMHSIAAASDGARSAGRPLREAGRAGPTWWHTARRGVNADIVAPVAKTCEIRSAASGDAARTDAIDRRPRIGCRAWQRPTRSCGQLLARRPAPDAGPAHAPRAVTAPRTSSIVGCRVHGPVDGDRGWPRPTRRCGSSSSRPRPSGSGRAVGTAASARPAWPTDGPTASATSPTRSTSSNGSAGRTSRS